MYDKKLVSKLLKASIEISKNLTSSSNYLIVSREIAEILENTDIKKHRKKKLIKINEMNKKASD